MPHQLIWEQLCIRRRFLTQTFFTPQIIQNDKVQLDYPHHLPPGKVRFLEMDGDVTLQKVVFSWERGGENYFPLE